MPNSIARLIGRALASAPQNVDAWLMKGDLARAMGDQAAGAAYQKALEISPENVTARLDLVSLEIATGKFDDARKNIEQVRKVAPGSALATYMQALLEFRQKNYTAARETVLQVLKAGPNYMPGVLLAGAIDYALGSYAEAQLHLQRIVEGAPNNLYARKLLTSALLKSGQAQRAAEVVQAGLEQAPDDSELVALAGEVYMQSNDFAKAAQYFEKAAQLDPKSAGVRTELGMSRLAAGDSDRALADLESAAQLDSGKFDANILLVTTYLQRANYDKALQAAAALETKQPDNPLTYNLTAAIYVGKKDTANARKNLEHALQLQPTYVPAAINLAQLDLQEKNPQAARGRLETILEKDKNNVQALVGLVNLGARIGATPQEQIAWLERAHTASPSTLQLQLMLARLYAQTGDAKKALDIAQQAQAAAPNNPTVLDTLGTVQIGAGEKEQALATYAKLAALQPNSPLALYRQAMAQAINADPVAAARTLKMALALKPDFIEAEAALVDLQVRAGQYPEAMSLAQQVQKQAAKSEVGFVLQGDVLVAEKKFLEAAKEYDIAYGMRKSGALAIKLHAAYTQADKPDEADARLASWLKESPDDAGARLYAANADLTRGKYPDAIAQYEWLLQKQPDNVLVLNNLAWAYDQVKDARAVGTAERAYKLLPDNAAVTDTLGWLLLKEGNSSRGLELLQKAVSAAPDAQDIRFHLAQAWLKTGEKARARTELERIVSNGTKFPDTAAAMDLLQQLKK